MLKIKDIILATEGKLLNGQLDKDVQRYSIDSREIFQGDFFIPIVGEKIDSHTKILDCTCAGIYGYFINTNFKDKENVIKESIKINKDICIVEVENTERALLDIGIYNRERHINIPIVTVTGSVGKTSTREIISSILETQYKVLKTERNYNSTIGVPIMLLKMEDQDVCVLEAGISEEGEMDKLSIALKPDVAVITNIGTSHIGNFGSQDKIFVEKSKIYKDIKQNGTVVINGDDSYLSKIENSESFSIDKYSFADAKNIQYYSDKIVIDTKIYNEICSVEINELGNHNIYNALCGIKVGEIFKVSKENIINGIKKYKNFSRRFEKIVLKNECVLIDDAYNSSLDSTKSGLESLINLNYKRKIVVLGDMLEQGEYAEKLHRGVGDLFKNIKVDILYTLGENAKYIAENAKQYLGEEKIRHFINKEDLINSLENQIKKDNVIYFKASNGMKFNEIIAKIEEIHK